MTICTYSIKPGSLPKLKRRIQEDVEPRISGLPSFIFSSLLEMNANNVTVVSLFDSKGHADLASGPIGFLVRAALGDYIL